CRRFPSASGETLRARPADACGAVAGAREFVDSLNFVVSSFQSPVSSSPVRSLLHSLLAGPHPLALARRRSRLARTAGAFPFAFPLSLVWLWVKPVPRNADRRVKGATCRKYPFLIG